ncbi:hypothetical protein [Vibrio breoganii]|uniref:hypothetical protein n=1 Tax=Vibrio breoganii TaxID=553239 RepID=UPI000C8149C8|nr:hypothetical protein [Vibrio breoganii]PMG84751.1 hypothetical protein BCU81_13790 [Vibrio breoganii]
MNKLFITSTLSLLLFSPLSASEEPETDIVEFITETFDISVSNSDFLGDYSTDYVFTLNGSYNINETWRVFGSVDTDEYLELGVGYSFFVADRIYNELFVTAGASTDNTYVTGLGLFSATKWKDFVFFTNIEGQYIERNPDFSQIDVKQQELFFKKLIGTSYEMTSWLALPASYAHDKNHYNVFKIEEYKFTSPAKGYVDSYVNLGVTLNLWGIKPFVSYKFDLSDSEYSYWEFSLSFDF